MRTHILVETPGMVPASRISPFVFNKLSGGGGGSRTRVRMLRPVEAGGLALGRIDGDDPSVAHGQDGAHPGGEELFEAPRARAALARLGVEPELGGARAAPHLPEGSPLVAGRGLPGQQQAADRLLGLLLRHADERLSEEDLSRRLVGEIGPALAQAAHPLPARLLPILSAQEVGGDLRRLRPVARRLAHAMGPQQGGLGAAGSQGRPIAADRDQHHRLAAREVDAQAAADGADGRGVENVERLAEEIAQRPVLGRDRAGRRNGEQEEGRYARPNVRLNKASTCRRWCWTSKQRSISCADRRAVTLPSFKRSDLKSPLPACASMAAFCTQPYASSRATPFLASSTSTVPEKIRPPLRSKFRRMASGCTTMPATMRVKRWII